MIISVSRRSDIPAFYAPWFIRRMQEGFALVRNPYNPRQVSRVALERQALDGMVFWSKNPLPLEGYLPQLAGIPFYIQWTMTGYGRDVEANIPDKQTVLLPGVEKLARQYGRAAIVWRYDPVFLTPRYTLAYHQQCFDAYAKRLGPWVDTCVVSFLQVYRHTARAMAGLPFAVPTINEQRELMGAFARSAKANGIALTTCALPQDYAQLGVLPGRCIDSRRLEQLGGVRLWVGRDKNQRPHCGCGQSVDIGAYSTCPGGCRYCYANQDAQAARRCSAHDPHSPLLFGQLEAQDRVTDRVMPSQREEQQLFFLPQQETAMDGNHGRKKATR